MDFLIAANLQWKAISNSSLEFPLSPIKGITM